MSAQAKEEPTFQRFVLFGARKKKKALAPGALQGAKRSSLLDDRSKHLKNLAIRVRVLNGDA